MQASRIAAAAAVCAALAAVVSAPGDAGAVTAAKVSEVQVVNDATTPVPVRAQGTTTVDGTVGIDPAKNTVEIGNSSSAPVPVQEVTGPKPEIFQKRELFAMNAGVFSNVFNWFEVPAGKRLEATFVSAHFDGPPGSAAKLTLHGAFGDSSAAVHIPLERMSFGSAESFDAAIPIELYVGAGDRIAVGVTRNNSSTTNTIDILLVGRLVNE